MPLIEKEIIAPGCYFYTDEKTGLPRKLDVTPELNKYWLEQGKEMLSAGLTIPVPYEHDFTAHPMTPKDKLLNNAGWVADYRMKDAPDGRKDVLFGVVDVQDEEVYKKLPRTIRWTSPWINSFTDGSGKEWKNVISHLALTTRPRISKQAPFGSIAAALSMATPVGVKDGVTVGETIPPEGFCLSRAGRLGVRRADKQLAPRFPMAFSLMTGIALGGFPPKKGKEPPKAKKPESEGGKADSNPTPGEGESEWEGESANPLESGKPGEGAEPGAGGGGDIDLPPLGDQAGDVSMEEVLCDLLRALGVDCESNGDESQFKRNLYAAAMKKVHELTNKGMNKDEDPKPGSVNQGKPPGSPGAQPNPLVQQEQQPMYMSLEDIQKIPDTTMRSVALSMYNENVKSNAERDAMKKKLDALEAAKLKEAGVLRAQKVAMLSRVSPKVKTDLEAMLAMPAMALSMGDGGNVVDPMEQTLTILERGLSDMPQLLTTPSSALSVSPHPVDDTNQMSEAQENAIVDAQVCRMGAIPQKRSA